MKIGFSLTIVPNVVYHVEECRAKPEMVVIDIPEDNLPMIRCLIWRNNYV